MLLPEKIEIFKRHLKTWERASNDSQVRTILDAYKKAASKTYVSCWHQNDGEPDWDAFRSKGEAIAIRTTGRMSAAHWDRYSTTMGQPTSVKSDISTMTRSRYHFPI